MKQFYETYKDSPKLSPLVRAISWSHNLAIFSRCKTEEERGFYLKLAKQENYSFRELDRQISASLFERTMIGNSKLSTTLRESNQDFTNTFKDSYVFEFLNLPEPYNENELQRGLVKQIKKFILELGKDFLFIGEEYKLQVVKYALSRSLSPTTVSEYKTQLPDKKLLQQKLHELFNNETNHN